MCVHVCDYVRASVTGLLRPFLSYARRLRSTDTATCVVRRSSNSFDDRCFAAAGPRLWNTLPVQLRHCDSLGQFKRLLKTYLFGGWDRGALWHLLGAPCINYLTYLLLTYLWILFIKIFIRSFILSSSFFFPRLFAAVGDWMSTILPHMMRP